MSPVIPCGLILYILFSVCICWEFYGPSFSIYDVGTAHNDYIPFCCLGCYSYRNFTDCSVPSIFMVRVCLTAASVVLGFAVTVTVVPFTVG